MTSSGYIIEQVVMEAFAGSMLVGFIILIINENRNLLSPEAARGAQTAPVPQRRPASDQCFSTAFCLDRSPARIARAGGKVHFVLRRVGLVIALSEILLFVDSAYVNGIWPIWLCFLAANTGGSMILVDGMLVTFLTCETLFRSVKLNDTSSPVLRLLWRAMIVLSAGTLLAGSAASFAVDATRHRRAQGVYLLWCGFCTVHPFSFSSWDLRSCLLAALAQIVFVAVWMICLYKVRSCFFVLPSDSACAAALSDSSESSALETSVRQCHSRSAEAISMLLCVSFSC